MLRKIMFVGHGDDGHNSWKCLACNSHIDAGYPHWEYPGDIRKIVGSSYKFCPICGIKFEGVQENTKLETTRFYPFDTTDDMKRKYARLKYKLEAIRERRQFFINDMNEYRDRVSRFLNNLDEYECNIVMECTPYVPKMKNW